MTIVFMKKVMVFGAFDILHSGHEYFFTQAKQYGEILIVVVGRDETIKKFKNRELCYSENERFKQLKDVEIVDEVVIGSLGDKYQVIVDQKPDVLVFGYDQQSFNIGIEEELKKRGLGYIEIKKIEEAFEPDKYKSSIIYEQRRK